MKIYAVFKYRLCLRNQKQIYKELKEVLITVGELVLHSPHLPASSSLRKKRLSIKCSSYRETLPDLLFHKILSCESCKTASANILLTMPIWYWQKDYVFGHVSLPNFLVRPPTQIHPNRLVYS